MNKTVRFLSLTLLILLLLSLVACTPSLDRIEETLREEEYLVRRFGAGGSDAVDLPDNVAGRISATGPKGEYLTVLLFESKQDAEVYYTAIKKDYTLSRHAIREGKVVMYGTRTAVALFE